MITHPILNLGIVASLLLAASPLMAADVPAKPETAVAKAATTPAEAERLVRQVADKMVAETTFSLRNRITKQDFTSSENLPADPAIDIPSRWNQWFYAALLVGEGLQRVGEQADVAAYREFQTRQVDFIAAHAAWFQRQWGSEKKKPGGAPRLGHYLSISSLWATGLAGPCITRHFETKDPRLADYVARFRRVVEKHPRDADGMLLEGASVRTDDIYLMEPGIFSLGVGTGEKKFIDDAVQQVLAGHRRLFDRERKIHRQSWNTKTQRFDGDFWGRGAGWMTLAITDLLGRLDKDHPRRGEVLAAFRETMDGLRIWQAPGGGWRQVLDEETAWVETSCSGMFTYAMARGVCEGWIDRSFEADVRKAWTALAAKALPDGSLIDICPATPQGNRAFYLARPRAKDDPHGYGPFLLAGSQILRLNKIVP